MTYRESFDYFTRRAATLRYILSHSDAGLIDLDRDEFEIELAHLNNAINGIRYIQPDLHKLRVQLDSNNT